MSTMPEFNFVGFEPTDTPSLTYLGGKPSLRSDESYPTTPDGQPWVFFAQVDLSTVPVDQIDVVTFPHEGLLQFFTAPDDLYGMNIDNYSEPDKGSLTLVRLISTDDLTDDYDVEPTDQYSPLNQPEARVYLEPVVKKSEPFGGTNEREDALDDNVDDDDAPWPDSPLYFGSCPAFTQQDFRGDDNPYQVFAGSDSGEHVMWGDSGIASWWLVDTETVAADTLTDAFIYWDCY